MTDLPLIGDGWHFLHFHMHTFVRFDSIDILDHFRYLLDWLAGLVNIRKESLYYIASTIQDGPESFLGANLSCRELEHWGIPADHILPCSGLAAYQNATLQTANNGPVRMIGQKVEVLYPCSNGQKLEIATFEIADTYSKNTSPIPVSAFVLGLERVAALSVGEYDIRQLPSYKSIIIDMATGLVDNRFFSIGPGFEMISSAILISIALFNAGVHFEKNHPIGNRGVGGQYKKMLRELLRILGLSGVSPINFFRLFQKHLEIDTSDIVKRLSEVNN
ncbi:MAG: hypothetical protein PHX54_10820 [Lentimicrobiaceae bacterium]|nr:hypothetical protein [Lentimicrobiaceae bacterium]